MGGAGAAIGAYAGWHGVIAIVVLFLGQSIGDYARFLKTMEGICSESSEQ